MDDEPKPQELANNIWALIGSWFTSTVLFCILNLIIGFIFLRRNHIKPVPPPEEHQQLPRAPSPLERRVKSFDFSLYRSETPHAASESEPDKVAGEGTPATEIEEEEEEVEVEVEEGEETALSREEEEEDGEETASSGEEEEEDGVDEKANDFINMFRQQLKLQRLDSMVRYREMLSRGLRK